MIKMDDKKIAQLILWLVSVVYLYFKLSIPSKIGVLPFKYLFLFFCAVSILLIFKFSSKLDKNISYALTGTFSLVLLVFPVTRPISCLLIAFLLIKISSFISKKISYILVFVFHFLFLIFATIPPTHLSTRIILFLVLFCSIVYSFIYNKPLSFSTNNILVVFLIFFFLFVFVSPNLVSAHQLAMYSPTILTDNWWDALNWIKNNTANCSVIATYWDPGHFITAIAERGAVYDGGCQNSKAHFNASLIDMNSKAFDDLTMYELSDGQIIRSRMKDMATVLYTDDEEKAIDILKLYKGNCSEMYFIASSDLVGKSQWWSYFATWSPNTGKGVKSFYYPIRLSMTNKAQDNSTNYVYSLENNQAFVVNEKNISGVLSYTPYLKQGPAFAKVGKIVYFSGNHMFLKPIKDAEVPGMIWMDPSKQIIYVIPEEIENSMFTRMYFFNGAGLSHFQLVNNWGGEVKLFKVKFD